MVGMWNPRDDTGYVQPPYVHWTGTLKEDQPQAAITALVEKVQARLDREAKLAGGGSLAQIAAQGVSEFTSVDRLIQEEERGGDPMAAMEEESRLCCKSSNLQRLEQLIDDMAVDVNCTDTHGNSLIMVAIQQGDKRIAKFLLRRGANVNLTNHVGNSVLHYCVEYGHPDLLKYMISKGADDQLQNEHGLTCYEGISTAKLGQL